jgi:hypothetical protein
MTDEAVNPPDPPAVPASVRAQLLATEHWGLLASRSTTQAEVLTRISIFLTLTSAGLVSLALAGQAMRFDGMFPVLALVVLAVVLVIGVLTQVRVATVAIEDLSYVLAMNRLRGAYAELDPGIIPYLMASRFDDRRGSQNTYSMLHRRGAGGQVAGSSMVFIVTVNSAVVGLFLGGLAGQIPTVAGGSIAVGLIAGLVYLAGSLWIGGRRYYSVWHHYTPLFPRPSDPAPG